MPYSVRPLAFALLAILAAAPIAHAQTPSPNLFSAMHWREIGPMRAGRTRALAGVPSQPMTFYMGGVGSGVFKTTDAGRTWQDLWSAQPSGSIGSIAVAESDPNTVYVASGEGLARPDLSTGDGIYKSTDAGKTWTHLGLRDGQQIGSIAVDPHDANRVYAAVTGHPYAPNAERGLFRSTDGGTIWKKVLYVDDKTGASEIAIDPSNPKNIFAGMWQRQEGPWENSSWSGTNGGLFHSTDGGDTWTKVTGGGLPDGIVQVNLTISPSNPKRIYGAFATARGVGIYVTSDGGVTWTHTAVNDARPEARIGGGDLPVLRVDPKDPDTLYSASTVTWKSTDAGKTWSGLRGAPGGDDYQNIFVNPTNTDIIALASDQGVIISLNHGVTWGEWYNQPTAQMYHVTADNAFPYRVCGGQQDSGSACVASRSDDGRITFHDWHPVGIEEYGYAAPDPLNPDLVYGGKVTVYDRKTGQVRDVEPKPLRTYRTVRTEPLQFSMADPHSLFLATNSLWLTQNAGQDWKEISPDLSRETFDLPSTIDAYKDTPAAKPIRRGVIYALGLSPLDLNTIWAGTDDGLIWHSSDLGGHWANVTPPELKPFWKVFNMDAGHFDKLSAYAAINTLRLDDMRPHLFRTHDGGKTWKQINTGIPDGAATSTIREDPKQKGLLYAGSETQVYVSFDDGDHWQSLRLNMPAVSIRDLAVKDDDLLAGTHGRGFMVLDDLTPLRQIAAHVQTGKSATLASTAAHLYAPQTAIRVRSDMNPPTPWPPDMATGENPPAGAILDYYLAPNISGPVTLEVLDAKGELAARFSSSDPAIPTDPRYPDPILWARPFQALSAAPGHHRFLWDMHYPAVPGMATGPDASQALPYNTPSSPSSPWVMPGAYTVRLIAAGKTQTESFTVVMDPRVKNSAADLQAQFDISKAMYDATLHATTAIHEATVLRDQYEAPTSKVPAGQVAALETKLEAIIGRERGEGGGARRGGPAGPPNLGTVRSALVRIEHSIQNADAAPTTAQVDAYKEVAAPLDGLLQQWDNVKKTDLKAINDQLRQLHYPLLSLDTRSIDHDVKDQIESGDDDDIY